VCVEKNERADDSRLKSGLQNVLGGMVLLAIPTVAANLLNDWSDRRRDTDRIEQLREDVNAIQRKFEEFEKWRNETNGNRFRWSDGDLLRQAIASNTQNLLQLEKSVTEHNRNAAKYIEKIEQMEKKSHYHSWQVESDKR